MRIILKDRITGWWLQPNGKWESRNGSARVFSTGQEAIVHAEAAKPMDIQVCFEAEDPNLSFELERERGDFVPPVSREMKGTAPENL